MSQTLHTSCAMIYKHTMVRAVEQPSSINSSTRVDPRSKLKQNCKQDDILAQVLSQALQWNPRPLALDIITSCFLPAQYSSSLAHIITFCYHNRINLQTNHYNFPLQESSNSCSSTTTTVAAITSCKTCQQQASKQERAQGNVKR